MSLDDWTPVTEVVPWTTHSSGFSDRSCVHCGAYQVVPTGDIRAFEHLCVRPILATFAPWEEEQVVGMHRLIVTWPGSLTA